MAVTFTLSMFDTRKQLLRTLLRSVVTPNKAVKPFVAAVLTRTPGTPHLFAHGFAIAGIGVVDMEKACELDRAGFIGVPAVAALLRLGQKRRRFIASPEPRVEPRPVR